ncbi:MAG: VWA domain-containing protein, partial [Elusimicrobia bacterium]|nr:VWA domain-containing protein [Elusimicrobiota bacterium]
KYDKTKSWVIGTMNPVKPPYKGEPPSGELSSRFGMTLDVKYLPPEEDEALLAIFFERVPKEIISTLVAAANELRAIYPDILPLPIAPRTLMHIVDHIQRFPTDDVADIFTKTYNPSSIVEDPAISEAIDRALVRKGLRPSPPETDEGGATKRMGAAAAVAAVLSKPKPWPKSEPKPEPPKQEEYKFDPNSLPPPRYAGDTDYDFGDMHGGLMGGRFGHWHRRLPPMPFTSPKGRPPELEVDQETIDAWAKVLENVARLLARYPPIRLVPFYFLEKHGESQFSTPRTWRVVNGMEEIHYLPEDLADPDQGVSLGRTAHESWHLLHSRPELIFDHPELVENMHFQALWWAVEDPRVNNLGLARHPGARPWIESAYARDYEIRDLELERVEWRSIPLHLQFNYSLVYEWWKGISDARVTDPRVMNALARARDAIARASKEPDAKRAFDIVLNEIWPIYRDLLDEATRDEMDRQARQKRQKNGQKQKGQQGKHKKSKPRPSDSLDEKDRKDVEEKAKDKMQKASKDYRDKHASKVLDNPEKMSEKDREKAKKEMEELRKKMEEAREKGQQQGQKNSQQAQEGQEGQEGQKGEGRPDGASKKNKAEKSDPKQAAKQVSRLAKPDQEKKETSLQDRLKYQDFLNRVRKLIPHTRRSLMQALKQKLRQRTIHGRDSGDLDEDALPSIPRGEKDVFKEEMSPNRVLYRVSLLIDTSGSMSTEKKERAVEGAVMMMEALEKVPGVVFEIVKYDSNPKVLKPYQMKLTPQLKSQIVSMILNGSGSTEAHTALKEAIERIRMGRGDRLIIMVNDGDPDNNFDRDQYRQMIKDARDVEVHGIGLGEGAQLVLDLFPPGQGWWLKDAAEFARNLRNILKKKLTKGVRIS